MFIVKLFKAIAKFFKKLFSGPSIKPTDKVPGTSGASYYGGYGYATK